ncbi:MAG: ribosomal L7Ae/L30e/S12e/Gadd45 family protein [Eubacteriales bacterium]|nr:ribosomal L7Ae/L30e/S12e/Gadd45 family protein [Eubacteriales bacterium]
MQDRVLSLLGLAAKAGMTASGGFSAEEAVKSRKARLVIVARDAQANTAKRMTDKCTFYKIPFRFYETKETLGRAVGKQDRACIAVMDRGFAESILKVSDDSGKGGGCGENENHGTG